MPQLSYASCWTILLAHFCKTTVCRSEIVLSQCHQNYSRQQNNSSTWSFLLQLTYSLVSPPQRPYKNPSSHTNKASFHWWKDVPGRNLTSSSDAPSNIQRYGILAQGDRLGAYQGSSITATSPTVFPGIRFLRRTSSGQLVPGIVACHPTSSP